MNRKKRVPGFGVIIFFLISLICSILLLLYSLVGKLFLESEVVLAIIFSPLLLLLCSKQTKEEIAKKYFSKLVYIVVGSKKASNAQALHNERVVGEKNFQNKHPKLFVRLRVLSISLLLLLFAFLFWAILADKL